MDVKYLICLVLLFAFALYRIYKYRKLEEAQRQRYGHRYRTFMFVEWGVIVLALAYLVMSCI